MGSFLAIFGDAAKLWQQHPVEFVSAILAGIMIGYFLSRLRHQGVIDTQKAQLALKDETIKLKDSAIAAATKDPKASENVLASLLIEEERKEPTFVPSEKANEPALPAPDPRFADVNKRITEETEHKIRVAIKNKYQLTFNPTTGRSKLVTFLPNGEVGEGRNDNEHTWRVLNGRLEFVARDGHVYSRFFLLPDGTFHHTNDKDTRSIIGQFMKRLV
ncbi:hypothetical protein [Bradyrhizobium sp. CCGB20]|uniref:hypothetical protein n=1 Tax=Bradyrhizobium sp. CCGB20 TaxID=2949633 RepID=UPI0020B2A19B|nr:hypothetical protein [Bradyrhizobium sp. CCGB20]MCP3396226.1 hypothetical protein [Bradyrhizobium sp. CCGB20]